MPASISLCALPRHCCALLVGLLLSACAGQAAFRDGQQMLAQNRAEEGLQKFAQAMQEDPRSAQFKAAWIQTRDRMLASYLQQAEQLAASAPNEARQFFQRALKIDPNHPRALAGVKALDAAAVHAQWLQEAQTLLGKKDLPAARTKLAQILLENPQHAAAGQLQRQLAEQSQTPPLQAQLAHAYRKPISIEFKDAAVKQVFEVIARTAGLNFLFDKDVRQDQKMSIILKNSTIEAAIHYALLTNQLEQQILDGNTILIYPNQAAKIKEYQEVVVRSFFLVNAEAKAVANSIKTIVKTRDIVVDEKLNMLILRDSPEAIKVAEKIVALHDQPEPEVMLEVEILEVKRTRLLELGIKWPESMSLSLLPSTTNGTLTLSDVTSNINSRTVSATVGATNVNARKVDSDVNLLANPRIRARNHEKAKVLIGERVPNITSTSTSTGFVSESVNYVDVGLKLDVEPTIFLDNDVAIKISLEVSNIVSESQTKSGTTAYRIGTRTASTVLRLKDGENQVLAGLINDEERRSANKVPGLGELPLLGRLFGSANDNNEKTEIVLSITPRLIRNIQRPEAALAEFRSGTEGSLRMRPDAPGGVTLLGKNAGAIAATAAPATPAAGRNAGSGGNAGGNGSGNGGGTSDTTSGGKGDTLPVTSAGSAITMPETGSAAPAPVPPQLQWQGPPAVKVGETFSLQLLMRSEQPIVSLPLALGFDNKVLQVTGIVEGDFLKQGGAQTSFTSKIEPNGQILIGSTRSAIGSSNAAGATENGSIMSISFRALAAHDSSAVQLLTIAPVTANGLGAIAPLPAPYLLQIRP